MNTCVSYRAIIINKRLSVIKREKREKKGEKKSGIRFIPISSFHGIIISHSKQKYSWNVLKYLRTFLSGKINPNLLFAFCFSLLAKTSQKNVVWLFWLRLQVVCVNAGFLRPGRALGMFWWRSREKRGTEDGLGWSGLPQAWHSPCAVLCHPSPAQEGCTGALCILLLFPASPETCNSFGLPLQIASQLHLLQSFAVFCCWQFSMCQ